MASNSPKKMSKTSKFFLVITSFIAIWLVFPLAILFSIGMLPTLVAIMTSKKNKSRITSVACFNLASLFPFMFDILNNFTTQGALAIVTNVFYLIFIYGTSAFAIILYQELPNIFTYFYKNSTKMKLKTIDNRLENLKEEYGQEELLQNIPANSI